MTYQELLTPEFEAKFIELSESQFGVLVEFSNDVIIILTDADKVHVENINIHLDVASNFITLSVINTCSIVQFIINVIIG